MSSNIKYFSKYPKNLYPLPNLVEIQLNSYKLFLEKGLKDLFNEIFPIKDYSGKDLILHFVDYYLDEPKIDELKAKRNGLSYEAPLRVKIKLENKKANETKQQEIFLTDLPLITPRGTFILNGIERVVISQLIRSAGVFFTTSYLRGKKLHGAKIIPNRGAWLELDTEYNGAIMVRIDRKRKIPATSLLRIFGLIKEEDILKEFKDVDNNPDIQYIKETLARDSAKTEDDAYLEIYKRLRPGDLAAVDSAKHLIGNMFNNFERYDLSEVGRYKLNQRLGLKTPLNKENRILTKQDLVLILKEIIKLNNDPERIGDDIDHLGNRRVRALGELLENKMRVGLTRMERIVRDRMSTFDLYSLTPAQLVNSRPVMAAVKEFFTSSQLSQFMNQINPLSELEHKRRLSAMGPGGLTKERAGFEVRDVHPSHYGRICPIETPEGPNIGLVGHLASYARINDYGFIETPYRRVKNGRVTNEIVYLNAFEEEKYNIAHAGVEITNDKKIKEKRVEARVLGEPSIIDREKIDWIDISPYQCISIATALIPFVEHDESNRALMGSNMQRQAVPLVSPQAPLVGTGIESKAAKDSGQVIVAEETGTIKEVDASHIVISTKGKTKTYWLHNFVRSNDYTCITQRPIVKKGQRVSKGDVLADSSSTEDGELALGQNILVAFMPWAGANFEDAIIISERLLKEDRFSSIHIEEFICEVRDTKLGPETTTNDIPNVGENRLKDLDEEGIIRIGAEVRQDDILVGKISPKGETDLTAEERLLRAIFGDKARDIKDTSKRLSHGKRGRVVGIKIFSREKGDKLTAGVIKSIQVEVAQFRKVMVGDKLAGRHGNKGVISKVLPEQDMPYLENGRPVDIILNPLGVASRMNLGQILETHLGWAAHWLGYRTYSPPFSGVTEEEIKGELKKAGLPENGKVKLCDGRTGEPFIQPVTVGFIYMMKLNHLVEDKIHMRSIGPYSLITQQPLGGKAQFGGQRFGEMEVWALEGYGAAYALQEMLTIKSDDVVGRANAYDSIIKGHPIQSPHIPSSFNVLVSELKSLGFSINPIFNKPKGETGNFEDFDALQLKVASPGDILSWSHGEVTKPETINYRTQRSEKDGLFCERIFGPEKDWECYCGKYRRIRYKGVVCDRCGVEVTRSIVRRERMGHIQLAVPVSHIWFLRGVPSTIGLALNISVQKLEKVIYFGAYIVTKVDENAREKAFKEMEREYRTKLKITKNRENKKSLKDVYEQAKDELSKIKKLEIISELTLRRLSQKYSDVFSAGIGAEAIKDILEEIDLNKEIAKLEEQAKKVPATQRKKVLARLRLFKGLKKGGMRPEWMFLTVLPIMPPDLRPMVQLDGGRYATSDVNDLYRRVINRNNRLKRLLELNAPEVICRNEKRMLQEAVDALIDNTARRGQRAVMASTGQRRQLKSLADMLRGKQGRFRQNLLGKRVDFSGRSVIVVGPELKIHQCGIPKTMALELFKPFVINKLIERELVYNIRGARRLIEEGADEVWAILEEVTDKYFVLLNRAPTLHRLGVQAFKPVLVEGLAIQIHPMVCQAFNADFDGDQMAVHLPLSEKAQEECKNIMLSSANLFKPATGDPIIVPTQDIVLGCYFITKIINSLKGEGKHFSTPEEAIIAYQTNVADLQAKIKVMIKGHLIETSIGRVILNSVLPQEMEFVNRELDNKQLRALTEQVIKKVGPENVEPYLDKIKQLGFDYATKSGISWSMADLHIPKEKGKIISQAQKEVDETRKQYQEGLLTKLERRARSIGIWTKAKNKIAELVPSALAPDGPVSMMFSSNARGSWSSAVQMAGMKGIVVNPASEFIELPVISSFKEGFNVLEYFISTHGGRKGLADTALKTAHSGYLTRRLIDVAQDVIIRQEDCGDKEGITIYKRDLEDLGVSLVPRLVGRVSLEEIRVKNKTVLKKGELISKEKAKEIEQVGIEKIKVRSPITCRTRYGLCQQCYGYDLGRNKLVGLGEAVGIVTAQAIGEPGTQLTLRTFHTGGVASDTDITQGLPRVEEIFEARSPRGKAVISELTGRVNNIKEKKGQKIIMVEGYQEIAKRRKKIAKEYIVPANISIWVQKGDSIVRGQQLCEGPVDLKEMFKLAGQEAVQRYIIKEVQKIYSTQGGGLNDKHIEVIIRQMLSRVRIKDSGDTELLPGAIVEKDKFLEENDSPRGEAGKSKKKANALSLIMGITKVALSTESFLSAASFMETVRILIKASTQARIDPLRGLKENVIIGKLIPAGTGYRGKIKEKKKAY